MASGMEPNSSLLYYYTIIIMIIIIIVISLITGEVKPALLCKGFEDPIRYLGKMGCLELLLWGLIFFPLCYYSILLVKNYHKLFGTLVLHAHNQDPYISISQFAKGFMSLG